MNKKAQLGKIITSIPIMLLIFVIMGVFIFISAGASLTKSKVGDVNFLSLVPGDDLMLKEIVVNVQGAEDKVEVKKLRVIDAFAMYLSKKINKDDFRESLYEIIDKGKCMKIRYGEDKLYAVYAKRDVLGDLNELEQTGKVLYFVNNDREISMVVKEGTKVNINYNYGECDKSASLPQVT